MKSELLFWTGIAIFFIGLIIRYIFKYKMYRDFTAKARTDVQKKEINDQYRPKIYVGLAIEVIGVIIGILSI